MQILQNFSVDVSKVIKQHIKDIKKLDPKTQRELGKIIGNFKEALDSLSEVDEYIGHYTSHWKKKKK